MALDLRTVVFMAAVSSLLMAIVLFGASRVYPRSIQGLTHWGWGALGFGVTGMLFASRDIIPAWLSILVANFFFVASYVLWWRGMRLLLGHTLRPLSQWGIVLAGVAVFLAYFTLVEPNIVPRLILISGISCLFYSSMAWLVWRSGRSLRGGYLFIGLMVFGGLATLFRVLATVLDPASTGALLTPSLPQTVYIVASNLLGLLDGIAFFLLATSKLQAELEQMAHHDSLTGTLNRRALMEQLGVDMAVARRKSRSIALIAMDLDHFKQINDTRGHAVGDQVLRHFSDMVQHNKRPQDVFARMGGEEFVLVLPDTDLGGAMGLAQRLHATLNAQHSAPDALAGLPAYTASFGVGVWLPPPTSPPLASTPPHDIESTEAWFRRVDAALYQAKAQGRNRIALADPADAQCWG